MGPKEWGSIGGQITRNYYIDLYNDNPNYCKQCGKIIPVNDRQKPSAIKKKKFCDRSCAAKFNNVGKNRWADKPRVTTDICKVCGKVIHLKPCPTGSMVRRSICDTCYVGRLHKKTKDEVFQDADHWMTARATITKDAQRSFKKSGRERRCAVCGYKIHTHVCHIRDIKDFPGDATISEINDISNLVTLCPNHHWEFDHGLLKLPS